MQTLSLTALRQNLFKVVDQVITTGIPVVIKRKGHRLKIVLDEPPSKLANLKSHHAIVGNPDELVELKVDEWQEEKNL